MTGARDEARERGGRFPLDGEKAMMVWHGPRDEALAARLCVAQPGPRAALSKTHTFTEKMLIEPPKNVNSRSNVNRRAGVFTIRT